MNRRTERAFCLALLVFSIAVRSCYSGSLRLPGRSSPLPADEPSPAQPEVWTVELLSAEAAAEQASNAEPPAAPSVRVPEDEPAKPEEAEASAPPETVAEEPPEPADEPPTPEPLCFTAAEADAIGVSGLDTFPADRQALLLRPSALDFSGEGPKVLIVHTHSSEAYTPEPGWEYTESDELRTEQPEYSVIRLGSRIAELLNAAGIETLHDTALNDYPVYSGAYDRMLRTIEDYLARYPSIQMVLDIHRDAASNPDGTPFASTCEVNGARCARVMLVIGTDGCGMPHPDWQENLANALKLQTLLERSAPGLCRDLDLRTERFNQHETKGSMIVEFGSTGNTLCEALRAADLFSAALISLIQGV